MVTAVDEVHILWISEGMSCDRDTVSITAAGQPGMEDVLLGAIPGLPQGAPPQQGAVSHPPRRGVPRALPQVEPESPGDLFDGGESDGLLTLGILSLTDEEKAAMRAADPRTRAILERTEALSRGELMRLHGRWR
jgi:hypothetical protein